MKYVMYGQNLNTYQNVTVSDCELLCDKMEQCQSFDYAIKQKMCLLNRETATSKPELFGKHRAMDYYQKVRVHV